jgi:hypothetical protein
MMRKRSDSGRPVVNSNMSRMSGALINHCMYRTYYIHSPIRKKTTYQNVKERTKTLRDVPLLNLNSDLTSVCPKLDAMVKYAIVDTKRTTVAI